MAGWIKMPLGTEVGLGPVDIVLNGDSSPCEKRVDTEPPILAHVYCGQTVRWIKMPLGREVGLGPHDIVLDGGTQLPQRGTAPNFQHMSVAAKGLDGSRCHLVLR